MCLRRIYNLRKLTKARFWLIENGKWKIENLCVCDAFITYGMPSFIICCRQLSIEEGRKICYNRDVNNSKGEQNG